MFWGIKQYKGMVILRDFPFDGAWSLESILESWDELLMESNQQGIRFVKKSFHKKSEHMFATGVFVANPFDTSGCPRNLGSMVRISGLFHLLVNGSFDEGYNPLILSFY